MSCAPGSDCCESCAGESYASQQGIVQASDSASLLATTRALIDRAELAVAEGGQCGAYGELEDVTNFFFGDDDAISSEDLCTRQKASLESLRLLYSQLEQLLANPSVSEGRLLELLNAIETSATGLIEEAELSSWAELARAYGRRVGAAAGEVVRGAVEGAGGAVGGFFGGLGLIPTLVIAAAVVIYLNPNVLRRS
jgi:hypothetical protein